MHRILIVDDEPLICKGLSSLLAGAGLGIEDIHTASNGFEALDYLRLEEVDLMITDIGMPGMNGIELMHQARLIKPWVQTIVVSAHETFQYAQMAMRLGARDYLIKPLNAAQLLDSVRNALLQAERPAESEPDYAASLGGRFALQAQAEEPRRALERLLADPPASTAEAGELAAAAGLQETGPYFAVIRIRPEFDTRPDLSPRDRKLLAYAVMNLSTELLGKDWNPVPLELPDEEVGLVIGWSEERYEDATVSKINQLDMIGRSLHHHADSFLRLPVLVGISQIARGPEFLHLLATQSRRALEWRIRHPGQKVFYYGDFSWSEAEGGSVRQPGEEEASAQTNRIVERSLRYIEDNYAQKGLTLHEVSQRGHVSPNYLSYLFKKNTGYNLWEYVIKLRMEEGRRLLLTTDLRRYEVAERVGYESPEHFSKIFKKYYGYSPSELKKESQGK